MSLHDARGRSARAAATLQPAKLSAAWLRLVDGVEPISYTRKCSEGDLHVWKVDVSPYLASPWYQSMTWSPQDAEAVSGVVRTTACEYVWHQGLAIDMAQDIDRTHQPDSTYDSTPVNRAACNRPAASPMGAGFRISEPSPDTGALPSHAFVPTTHIKEASPRATAVGTPLSAFVSNPTPVQRIAE